MNAARNTLVFDWNGTLFDDFQMVHDCINLILAKEGHAPIDSEKFRAHYNVPFEELYQNLGLDPAQVEKLMNHKNGAFHDHYEPLAAKAGLRAGAREILAHAHKNGVRSVILSNHIVVPIRAQLKRLKIEHLFADVLAYADRATQFHDLSKGERLERYIKDTGVAAATTLIVGDSVEEIEIARAQGLTSVAITGGCASEHRPAAEKPDYLIHSLRELAPIMQKRGFVS